MKEAEKIIWEYLDNNLSSDEMKKVEARIANEPAFKQAFDESISLHNSLKGVESDKAPSFILSNVMVSIKDTKIYTAPATSFGGMKYILLALTLLSTLTLITISMLGTSSKAPDTKWNFAENISGALKTIQLPTMPTGLENIHSYASVLGCLLIMFWIDLYLNKLKVVKTK